MTLEDMEKLKLENIFFTILELMVDFSVVPLGEEKWIVLDNPDPLYNRVKIYTGLTMPSLEDMNVRFGEYKAQMILDEESRISDIKTRLEAMTFLNSAVRDVFPEIANVKIWVKDLLKNENREEVEDTLYEVESAHVLTAAKFSETSTLESYVTPGAKIESICRSALHLIAGYNYAKGHDKAKRAQMKQTFSEIKTYLDDSEPREAKLLIETVSNVEFDELKQLLLLHFEHAGV